MLNNNLKTFEESFDDLLKDWEKLKERAISKGEYEMYGFFLKEMLKEFSKLYTTVTKPGILKVVEKVLKIITCEIKGNVIKYKKSKLPF